MGNCQIWFELVHVLISGATTTPSDYTLLNNKMV